MWHTHWLKEVPVCMYFFLVWKPVISVACTCALLLLCHEYLHDTIRLHWIEIQMKCTTQKHSLPLFTGRHEPDSDTIVLFFIVFIVLFFMHIIAWMRSIGVLIFIVQDRMIQTRVLVHLTIVVFIFRTYQQSMSPPPKKAIAFICGIFGITTCFSRTGLSCKWHSYYTCTAFIKMYHKKQFYCCAASIYCKFIFQI